MSKETPHIPNMPTTPEQVLAEKEVKESTGYLSPEQIKEKVGELFELSAARAEAGKHSREAWGGLTKEEREELKADGKDAILAHLEATRLDPDIAEFRETALEEYDDRIAELSSNPKVLESYKSRFGQLKETLANVLSYEHLCQEESAVSKAEEKLRKLYEKIGKTPGPIERKKLEEISGRKSEIEKSLKAFELNPETIDMLQRREIRRTQQDLERYSFAETESRAELIREVLPDLLQGAPVLFQGETGSGKSQLAKYISEKYLGKKPVIISVSEQIKESQIIGSRGLEAGQTVFNYSEFVKAQKEGRPAILDEVNLMPHEFAGIIHDLLQKRVGDIWIHPATGEEISIKAPIMATANLKSERYKQRYELDVATLRRFIGGAGAREIHYLDIGKKDKEGNLIAPETLKILSAVLSDRHGEIQWNEKDAPQKVEELKRFVQACRKIQEDFTLSIREGAEESLSRGDRLAFRELVITLKDQIEIMKAWKASGFRKPLDSVILKEFFHKAEISGRAAKDRENMVKVFIANKLFQDTKPDDFKIQGLSPETIRQWQGKE
jgi:hypothetical protein